MKKINKWKWYTNGIETIKVYSTDIVPEGFYPGRTFNTKPWNKGLTSKTDPRVKSNCDKCHETRIKNGSYENPWNKGLTKDSNNSLKIVAEKLSEYQRKAYAHGKQNPRKGLHNSEESRRKQSIKMKEIAQKRSLEETIRMQAKSDETKLKNKSFKSSKEEDKYYLELLKKFTVDDIKRQYKDSRYPFKCDFYIESLDLFIELNGYWHHGPHPFNPNNKEDLNILKEWEEKSLTKESYKNAIEVWTQRDVKKLETFKHNNLNYIIEYPNKIFETSLQ